MSSVISKFIIKTLCDNQGSLDFECLDKIVAQNFTDKQSVLRSVLFDDGKIVIQEGRKKATAGQLICSDSLIVAKTSLRLCQQKPGECPQCDGLHLCRYFVCGKCSFGNKCKTSHSLVSPYNTEILKRYDLHDLTEKQLFQLLLQNDPYLVPEIFKGFSEDNIKTLHEIYRNKLIIMGQQATAVPVLPEVISPKTQPSNSNPVSPAGPTCPSKPNNDADGNEICLYFIRMHCSFKEKCGRVHWHLPYKWQVLDTDGVTWKDLQNMEDIEKAYCDPQYDKSCMVQPMSTSGTQRPLSLLPPVLKSVDFMTMTYEGSPVRRLSTASSVSKPPHYILTTQWLWYWRDEGGKWLEYGRDVGDTPASVTSQTLENVYLADKDAEIPFSAGKQQYVLHFRGELGTQQMYQQNVKYKTKREIRRRPLFVSAQDVKMKLNSKSSNSSNSSTAESVPSHWDKSALPDFGYKLVPLSESVDNFIHIATMFKHTMPNSTINSIQRIQNPSLWKVFEWQKALMKERNGGKLVNEKHLFHGTDESLIEAICEQNFDWRMCGVNGTAYGKGSYFARDASYSKRYSKAKGSQKIMFVARVLVGEYTRGSSRYVRPPPKGNSRILYDSCVDNESNPSIYVVFEKHQIYPEYLINYS